jgi:hypothetical protein
MKSFKNKLLLILPVVLCGCDSPAERLFKEQIQITNEAADRKESGKWDAIYGQSISSRMMANLYKREKLKISAEEQKRLEEKYGPEMKKARARLTIATEKMSGKPRSRMPNGMLDGPETSQPAENEKAPAEESKPEGGRPDDKKPPSPRS